MLFPRHLKIQMSKGCLQPRERGAGGAQRVTWVGNCSKKGEFGVSAEPGKETHTRVQQRPFSIEQEIATLVFLARNITGWSSAAPGIPPFSGHLWPGKLQAEDKPEAFLFPTFSTKKKCWHKTGRCLRSGCRKVTSRWRVGHPVIFKLLSLLRAQSQITSWCNAAGSSVLVHEDFWSCAQKGGKCEGEIGGYLTRRWHWVVRQPDEGLARWLLHLLPRFPLDIPSSRSFS